MAKPKTVLSDSEFAALPENVTLSRADLYTKTEDGYVLNVEPVKGWDVKPVEKLMAALGSERTTRADLESKLKALDGLDPRAAREALAKVKEWQESPPEARAKAQADALLKEAQTKYQQETSKLRGQLERELVEAKAREALAKHKGNVDLLLPHVKGRIKAEVDTDGELRAYVVDQSGNKAHVMGKDGSMQPMSIESLVEQMRAQDSYAAAFQGSGASGAGTQTGRGGSTGAFTISASQARNDPRAYQAVRDRAIAAGQQVQITQD
jgi:hypothetical protein